MNNGMDMYIRVIQDYLNFYFLEHVHVSNGYNQHVEHVEVDYHYDP